MKSIAYLPASNQSANASLMTVTNIRAALASTIKVNTVANAPVKFAGTMGTPHTFTDPVTAETITIISEASAVDFFGSISGSDVVIDQIAAGYTDLGSKVGDIIVIKPITEGQNNLYNIINQSHNDDGSIKDAAITYNPNTFDHIFSGGIWSALTGLNAAMTALVAYQAGIRGTVAAVASRAFTLSKDTYVDILRTTSGYTTTYSLVYTEVANNATPPALAANSIRVAKVVTNGTTVTSIIQGYGDLLGNEIYPMPTPPKLSIVAGRTGDAIYGTGWNVLAMDDLDFNTGGFYRDAGGYALRVTKKGLYRVTAHLSVQDGDTNAGLIPYARLNGGAAGGGAGQSFGGREIRGNNPHGVDWNSLMVIGTSDLLYFDYYNGGTTNARVNFSDPKTATGLDRTWLVVELIRYMP